jgi:hypothetical protein
MLNIFYFNNAFFGIFTSVLVSGIYYNGGGASYNAFKTSKSTSYSDGTSHIALRAWNKKRIL